ncbi:MAG: SDR family oxidoreductase [Tabrizicola sp.]|jgi:NAD(P)-dependent dehydrogenase (short-subunit alcohol dehydrogenase family)|nr:SDR family oxidoreductase [Tabrizicola sp.]
MTDMAGKTALITGATGGIGRATAAAFVSRGANVVLADLDRAALDEMAAAIGPQAAVAVCDVTDEAQTAAAVALAAKTFGGIDVAVLNAGIEGKVGLIGDMALADFDRVMNVNVRGVFIGLSAVMPAMRAAGKGGSIVILSSTAGRRGTAALSPYITSKHAVVGLMKCAALEGAADNIRVNCVNPGPIETRMMRQIEANASPEAPGDMKALLISRIPLQRYGEAEEVAEMIAFLGSSASSYCTGNIYGVDGGLTAG